MVKKAKILDTAISPEVAKRSLAEHMASFWGEKKTSKDDYNRLTGKVYTTNPAIRCTDNDKFQLEAVIDGNITRLVAEGNVTGCVNNSNHELELKRISKVSYPPIYVVGCRCGYEIEMTDINHEFVGVK